MFERRLQVLLAVLAFVCLLLVARAVSLQAAGRGQWTEAAAKLQRDVTRLATVRGRVLDVKGRELARDEPCIDARVHYQAIAAGPDTDWSAGTDAGKWLRGVARGRLRRATDYDALPLARKKPLLAMECERVKADIDAMWRTLATLSGRGEEFVDEARRGVMRQVETQRRLAWYRKYQNAATSRPAEAKWYDWLVGKSDVRLDHFADVHVDEETNSHVVLADISYELRNELGRRIEQLPGLELREGVRRFYPYGPVACQTIGTIAKVTPDDLVADPNSADPLLKYSPTDDIGHDGLERLCEQQLRGRHGVEENNGEQSQRVEAVPGGDVRTTIDVALQAKVEQAFRTVDFVRHTSLDHDTLDMPGAAVILDIPTGQVRALASWPTYDLNKYDELLPTMLKDQINRPLLNRALRLSVEPGSTVKPVIGIGAITSGVIKPMETIHCDGYFHLGPQKQQWGKCWTARMFQGKTHMQIPSAAPHPTNDLTFPEALQRSCNVFHETLANRMGTSLTAYWFGQFGLGRKTGVGLPESAGLLPDEQATVATNRVTTRCLAGIGEGMVQATPIQMANVAATIARDGRWQRPTLLPDQAPETVDLPVLPAAMAEARLGMYDVVNTRAGTGLAAAVAGEVFSAKTGSAQTGELRPPRRDEHNNRVRDDKGRVIYDSITLGTHARPNPLAPWYRGIGEDEQTPPAHGWMIGYAPSDHPKIAFAVLVEYGGGGGSAAGSVVKQLIRACVEEGYLPPAAE